MKIAIISTCAAAVPPRAYGGIELFVAVLARELTVLGHAVTVYATGDSHPSARLRYIFPSPIWPPDYSRERDHAAFAWRQIAREGADIVHVNLPDALFDSPPHARVIVTLHHPYDPKLASIYARHPHAQLVAISHDQARAYEDVNHVRVIHHGLDPAAYPLGAGDGGYVAFLGRIGPEKAPHLAIDAARRARAPLVIAGPHWSGRAYYDDYFAGEMAPRLGACEGGVLWRGELDHAAKVAMLQHAQALLMPSSWSEPFGLVMIEAMLTGTPVIAYRSGSAPEIVDAGVTGMIVNDAGEMADAIPHARRFDRARCRAQAVARFSASAMASRYAELYEIVNAAPASRPSPAARHRVGSRLAR